jgi:hypothetical protein
MVFATIFEKFVDSSPICVMLRAVMENLFAPSKLDAVFHQAAVTQYERELLFSTLVDLTSLVVCRVHPSMHAAYEKLRERIPVSVSAVYAKLRHVEPATARQLVQTTAGTVAALIDRLGGCRQPLLPGYRVRILDGNHFSGTDHRLAVLRPTSAGALPGQALALLDPQRMVIDDIIPCEDGHAQERSLLEQVLPVIQARDLLIDDRNFCTAAFLGGLARRQACFITRQHGRMPLRLLGQRRRIGRCATGRVDEQPAVVTDPQTGAELKVRRVTVRLDQPTRDGDRELHLLTNLPAKKANAIRVATLYRQRWNLETAFQELTVHLRCELNSLGYPRAAVFAFSVAVCCYNQFAAVQGALRAIHGEKVLAKELSTFALAEEVRGVYRGMMIALPPTDWLVFQTMRLAELARTLLGWARRVKLTNYRRHERGPKKPPPRRPNAQFRHVSTAKLLAEKRLAARPKPKELVAASP